mmetsp:Transcript_51819/g.89261  ORF Transcript_51819/g.89261 Transcript_51819/m.89261 type:complete len:148 (+) Transcript_51819:2-445(+)
MKQILLNKGCNVRIPRIRKQKQRSKGELEDFVTMTKEELDKALADYKEVKATALKKNEDKAEKAEENKEKSKAYHEQKKRKAAALKAKDDALKAAQKKSKKILPDAKALKAITTLCFQSDSDVDEEEITVGRICRGLLQDKDTPRLL